MQLNKISDFLNNISEKPILTTTIVLGLFTVIVAYLSYPLFIGDPEGYFKSILIEAHSMLFDLFEITGD